MATIRYLAATGRIVTAFSYFSLAFIIFFYYLYHYDAWGFFLSHHEFNRPDFSLMFVFLRCLSVYSVYSMRRFSISELEYKRRPLLLWPSSPHQLASSSIPFFFCLLILVLQKYVAGSTYPERKYLLSSHVQNEKSSAYSNPPMNWFDCIQSIWLALPIKVSNNYLKLWVNADVIELASDLLFEWSSGSAAVGLYSSRCIPLVEFDHTVTWRTISARLIRRYRVVGWLMATLPAAK